MWRYRVHEAYGAFTWPLLAIIRGIDARLWTWCHYQRGAGPRAPGPVPSLWSEIARAWRYS